VGVAPGVCLVRGDIEAAELVGREVVLLRSGALGVLLEDRAPVELVDVPAVEELAGWTTVNHQVVVRAHRGPDGRVSVDSYRNFDSEFGYTIRVPQALRWVGMREAPSLEAGAAAIRAVASGPREVCRRYDNCDDPRPADVSVAVSIEGLDGPPGRVSASVLSPDLLELAIRPLPWVRVVVRQLDGESSVHVWASTRHEFVLSSPPSESAVARDQSDDVFVHVVRVAGDWEESRLEATYLGWGVPDVPGAVLRDPTQWAAFVAALPAAQVRRADVSVVSSSSAG